MIIKLLFTRKPLFGLRVTLFALLAITLMLLDYLTPYIAQIKKANLFLSSPFHYIANASAPFFSKTLEHLSSRYTLLTENATLKEKLLILQARMQKMSALERENRALLALLQSAQKTEGDLLATQIIAFHPDPYKHQVILDKGTKDGVYIGQPVLDAAGVMGQVIDVSYFTSRVLLLSDSRSAIPVENNRNGVKAIATGQGSGTLTLSYVPETADIQVGDIMVTSGLAKRFSAGYPVGIVTEVKQLAGEPFMTILLKPIAHIDRSRYVLLIWPSTEEAPVEEKIAQ